MRRRSISGTCGRLKLARDWQASPRKVIETCLQAVKSGLLELRWDLLCPRCRVAKSWTVVARPAADRARIARPATSTTSATSRRTSRQRSARPPRSARCSAANIACSARCRRRTSSCTSRSIRASRASFAAELPFGPYRLRTLEPGPEAGRRLGGRRLSRGDRSRTTGSTAGPPARARHGHPDATAASRRLTAIVEDRRWVADALTADRITAIQAFRDLFAERRAACRATTSASARSR